MPETMPGFLLIAGTVLFVLSFFKGPLKIMQIEIPGLSRSGQITLRVLGIIFLIIAGYYYYQHAKGGYSLELLPILKNSF